MLYEAIDTSGGFYRCPVDASCRSRVNAPFVIKDDDAELTKKFLAGAEAENLTALAGHRSVGGCRVALQRHARRRRRQARDLHEEVPGGQLVFLKMWCDTRISPEPRHAGVSVRYAHAQSCPAPSLPSTLAPASAVLAGEGVRVLAGVPPSSSARA